jgi:cutinase
VQYPANLLDPTSVARGTVDLVHHLITRAAECPDTPFIVAGYSQGAAIVHSVLGNDIAAAIPGIARLPVSLYSRIKAVLLFGDPLRLVGAPGLPGPWHTGSWCTTGDPVCQLGGLLILAHVSYGNTIAAAAQFAANAL